MIVRPATVDDAPAVLAIYAPIVRETSISFEMEPPGVDEMAARIAKCVAKWAWLVAESDRRVVGYAYGGLHRERAAYQWSTEVSAYVAADARRSGVGRTLYRELLPALAARGYFNAYAGIALPNPASVRLHESVGFRSIGVFPSVGYKLGRWHDVGWFHAQLQQERTPAP